MGARIVRMSRAVARDKERRARPRVMSTVTLVETETEPLSDHSPYACEKQMPLERLKRTALNLPAASRVAKEKRNTPIAS